MEVQATSEFETLFPTFVLHKRWEMPDGFNERLAQLAREDCAAHRVTGSDPAAVGDLGHYVAHMRHNFPDRYHRSGDKGFDWHGQSGGA